MKSNTKVYFVVILVILVWSILFYRIFSSGNDSGTIIRSSPTSNKVLKKVKEDDFKVSGNYRDPFLGISAEKSVKKNNTSTIQTAMKASPTVSTVSSLWPKIEFLGQFKNQNSSRELILLKINQNSIPIKRGETTSGVTLANVYRDSILVLFNKEKKIIRK